MYWTLHFIVTHLPNSLSSVRDHFLARSRTELTVDLLEEHLLAAEKSIVAVGAARGAPRTPIFEGCSPSPLAPSFATDAAVDFLCAESSDAASAPSGRRRNGKGKGAKGSGGGTRGGGVVVEEVEEEEVAEGLVAGVLAGVVASVAEVEAVAAAGGGGSGGGCGGGRGGVGGGGGGRGGGTGAGQRHAEGDCYLCMPPDPGIEAAALGTSESALSGTAPAEALHTFTPDPGIEATALGAGESALSGTAPAEASHTFTLDSVLARSTTVLPCPAVPSGSLSGLHLPSFSTNLVSYAVIQDHWVDTFTPGGQRVAIYVWVPAHVRGQGGERYTTVFPLRTKGEVPAVLIPWIRAVRLQLRRRFRTDLPVLRLHSDRGGEFTSDLLRAFCQGEGIEQSFTLPGSPHQNGVAERRIGLFYHPTSCRVFPSQDVTFDESVPFYRLFPYRTAPLPPPPLFLAPGPPPANPLPPQGPAPSAEGGDVAADDAMPFCRSPRLATPPGFPPRPSSPPLQPVAVDSGAAGGGAARGAASGGVEPPASAEPGGAEPTSTEPEGAEPEGAGSWGAESAGVPLGLPLCAAGAGGPAVGGTAARSAAAGATGAARHGDAGIAGDSGSRRARTGGTGAARTGGAVGAGGASSRGVESTGAPPGAASQRSTLSRQQLRAPAFGVALLELEALLLRVPALEALELVLLTLSWRGTSAGDPGAGGAGSGGAAAGGTGAGGPGAGAVDSGVGDPGASGASSGGAAAGGTEAGDPGAGGAGSGGAASGAGGGGAGAGDAGAGGSGAAGGAGAAGASTGGAGAGGTAQPRLFFAPPSPSSLPPPDSMLRQVHTLLSSTGLSLQPGSPLPAPPSTEKTDSLTKCRELASRPSSPARTSRTGRRVPRERPPPVPGTHAMALRPSSAPQRVPLPSPPASSLPDVPDPESDLFRAAHPTVTPSLVAESESVCPPSVGGECALGTDVLEDRQEDFECLAPEGDPDVPHLVAMLLAPEGDPDALDIPTPRSYAKATMGPYSSQWHTAMDAEMASWKFTGTDGNAVPPPGANIVDGMWIFKVKR
ncbi:unnamed protein product [Closterium sp. Yama58-4]|nr:unnamed protein product [Closterium sp. Yama58-4]